MTLSKREESQARICYAFLFQTSKKSDNRICIFIFVTLVSRLQRPSLLSGFRRFSLKIYIDHIFQHHRWSYKLTSKFVSFCDSPTEGKLTDKEFWTSQCLPHDELDQGNLQGPPLHELNAMQPLSTRYQVRESASNIVP